MNRYFITSRKSDGYYHVKDREHENQTVARCQYKEQAELVWRGLTDLAAKGDPA